MRVAELNIYATVHNRSIFNEHCSSIEDTSTCAEKEMQPSKTAKYLRLRGEIASPTLAIRKRGKNAQFTLNKSPSSRAAFPDKNRPQLKDIRLE